MATIHRISHSGPAPRSKKAKRRARKPASAGLGSRLLSAATSGPAKAAYVTIGTLGLAAVAVAILGPKRLEKQVLIPLRKAVAPQAEKLWDQASPVRTQLTRLFRQAGAEGDKLASDFQSWIGHFRAR
jgi:hypothetical protein